MSKDHTKSTRYVDIAPATPSLSSNTSSITSFWPTPHADASISSETEARHKEDSTSGHRGQGSHHQNVQPGFSGPLLSPNTTNVPVTVNTPSVFPPVELSKQLASTPLPTSSASESHIGTTGGLYTPPNSAARYQGRPGSLHITTMDDPNRPPPQRQFMGPPETPSRMMHASPNMFPSLQFSPDMFSTQSMGPMTAPAYPQQRLFWDSSVATPQSAVSDQYYNPYQDAFNASLTPIAVAPTGFTPLPSQEANFDLPLPPQVPMSFLDTPGFPAPFHTSPRMPTMMNENPAQFLSSPARRFGGTESIRVVPPRKPAREVPAYHQQVQESKREMELERDRRRNKASKRADDELIMKSVRRALSPSKSLRPGLRRSVTHSGIAANNAHQRHQNRVSFNDAASISSKGSNSSIRNGRSSPLKRTSAAAGFDRPNSFQKTRTSVSLAIDENGVAKTILADLAESDIDDDMHDAESFASGSSSVDPNDTHMLQSQPPSFAFASDEVFPQHHSHTTRVSHDRIGHESAKRLNRLSLSSFSDASGRRDIRDTVRPQRLSAHTDALNDKGDAQKALRAIIQDRSRSASTQDDYPSSRQSDASVQFTSSPPIHQNQFGTLNGSPTTITDPDLATPSTDQESYAMGAMRCVCSSTSPDNSGVVQCELCSKWLHVSCVGIDQRHVPDSYVCVYCEQTPMRHPGNRSSMRSSHRGKQHPTSPLAHKSVRANRTK